jgi:hypothetical protein
MRERWLLFEAWCMLLGLDLALRCLPFARVLHFCRDIRTAGDEGNPRSAPPVTQLAWLVTVAGRYSPATATCLTEALALSWLLSRRGIATNIRIGVAHRHGDLAAHAWLEQDGRVILGKEDAAAYAPLRPLSHEAVHP